jgi:hypothetical protein
MLDVLRYSSRKVKPFTLAFGAIMLLSGCSASTYENKTYFEQDNRGFFEKLKKEPKFEREDFVEGDDLRNQHETHVQKSDPEVDTKVKIVTRKPVAKSVEKFNIDPIKLSRVNVDTNSAACRYLRKSADAEAFIVGSPTLSASSDDEGSGSVNIGMNLLDFHKADLIRASGDARCRLHEASKKIEATLGLGVEANRFARSDAKAKYIRDNLGYLNKIERRSQQLLNQGALTVQDTNLVSLRIDELKAEMQQAQAEADQRRGLPAFDVNQVRSRHGALVEATSDLQNIEREIRTNDALELSVNTGYRYNETFNETLQRNDNDGVFASVSVGVRLGALSAQRNRAEEEAAGARLDALFEENTGTIWKSGFSDRAISRMVADLKKSDRELTAAMIKANDTINRLGAADRPEVMRARLQTKLEKVRVGANRAAVRASIRQLEENQRKIRALSD